MIKMNKIDHLIEKHISNAWIGDVLHVLWFVFIMASITLTFLMMFYTITLLP